MRELRIDTGDMKTKFEPWPELKEIKEYYKDKPLPLGVVRVNETIDVADCALYVKHHLLSAEANNGNKTFRPYLDRLIEFKAILEALPVSAWPKPGDKKTRPWDKADHSEDIEAYVKGPKKTINNIVFD